MDYFCVAEKFLISKLVAARLQNCLRNILRYDFYVYFVVAVSCMPFSAHTTSLEFHFISFIIPFLVSRYSIDMIGIFAVCFILLLMSSCVLGCRSSKVSE